ncbi:MAG: hypothetical protein Q4B91_03425 [Atopobiaceae bacterium]|nr:hypothetical protein [Atopobiaceae bacterium]
MTEYPAEMLFIALGMPMRRDIDGGLIRYIANLIEPPLQCPHYHSDRHYCSVHEDVAAIDSVALLALADEMDSYTRCRDDYRCGRQMPPLTIHDYARRIREACGVAS